MCVTENCIRTGMYFIVSIQIKGLRTALFIRRLTRLMSRNCLTHFLALFVFILCWGYIWLFHCLYHLALDSYNVNDTCLNIHMPRVKLWEKFFSSKTFIRKRFCNQGTSKRKKEISVWNYSHRQFRENIFVPCILLNIYEWFNQRINSRWLGQETQIMKPKWTSQSVSHLSA